MIFNTDVRFICLQSTHSNYDSSSTYYVGLTNGAIASNRENVLDCSAYTPLIQPLVTFLLWYFKPHLKAVVVNLLNFCDNFFASTRLFLEGPPKYIN